MLLYAAVVGWVLGLLFAEWWRVPVAFLLTLLPLGLAAWLGRHNRYLLLAAVCSIALVLGVARMSVFIHTDLLSTLPPGKATVHGVVMSRTSRTTYAVRVDSPAHGLVFIHASRGTKLRYGDLVSVTGVRVAPSDLDAYQVSLLRSTGGELIFDRPSVAILDVNRGNSIGRLFDGARRVVQLLLERNIPSEYSPLAEGLLLGGSSDLSPEISAAFRATGTSHIVAASGYNVTVVAAVLLALLRPLLGPRRAVPVLLVGVFLYAGLAGFSASIVRAAIMGGIAIFGVWLGRRRDASAALLVALLLMTIWQPGMIFDVGAQLSFAATAGLIWLYPVVLRILQGLWRPLAEGLAVVLTAEAATVPLALHYFGTLSPWGTVANLIVEPLVPAGMLLSALAAVASLWSPVGRVVSALDTLVLSALVGAVEQVAALPGSGVQLQQVAVLPLIAYYAVVAFAVWLGSEAPAVEPAA